MADDYAAISRAWHMVQCIHRRGEVKVSDKGAVCAPGRLNNRVVLVVSRRPKMKEDLAAYIVVRRGSVRYIWVAK